MKSFRNLSKSFLLTLLFIWMFADTANAHHLAPEALENARLATVAILDKNNLINSPWGDFKGTGVHLGDGYILTARHVVFSSGGYASGVGAGMLSEINILTADYYDLSIDLVGSNEFTDVALYRVSEKDRNKIRGKAVFAQTESQVGDDVFTTGYPLNWGLTKTFGHVGDVNVYLPTSSSRLLNVDFSVCSGNSGSGVFNEKGELVGIDQSMIFIENTGCSRFAFVIPLKLLKNVVGAFMRGEQPVFPVLGLELKAIKHGDRWMAGVKDVKSPLAGGVKAGDILLSINNVAISDAAQFKSWLIENVKPGDVVSLRVLRNKKEVVVKIKPGSQ